MRLRSASEDDARACEGEDADANLPVLVRYEDPLLEPEIDGVEILRGRGIEICLAWLSFENFLADMGEAPLGRTLERNDPDGNYEPANCCWVPKAAQNLNKRNSRVLTFGGVTRTMSEWDREFGLKEQLKNRLRRGWPLEVALKTPLRPMKPASAWQKSCPSI